MRTAKSGWLTVVLAVASAVFASAQPVEIRSAYSASQGIAPRVQWNANYGYCGEVCLISAGLHFGQYCSQYTARKVASPSYRQSDPESQVLLGARNADSGPFGTVASFAARQMRLEASEFRSGWQFASRSFLGWMKENFLRGRVVIIGVFNNGVRLGEWTGRDDGDPDYDHIVPVMRIGSEAPLAKSPRAFLPEDVVTISDNGLYTPSGAPQFFFSYRISGFTGNRAQANNPDGPLYLLKKSPPNYGIAVAGPLDRERVTIPVTLHASRNSEPPMAEGRDTPPAPAPLTLTATVHLPDASKAWNVYCYTNFADVPAAGFNAASNAAVRTWHYPGGSSPGPAKKIITVSTNTAATIVFRAVPATAP